MRNGMINKNIKLIALDLDGTTLTSKNTLSDKTKTAIKRAVAGGIEVVVASGRPFGSMPDSILKIEGINYIVSSNGAAIHDASRQCVYRNLLDERDVLKILELTAQYDLIFEAFINGLTYTDLRYINDPMKYSDNEAYIDYVRASHGYIEDMRTFIFEHRSELDSLEIVCADKVLREHIWQQCAACISGVYITSSSANFIEFMSVDATKANAVKRICDELDIDTANICACGNADNDADMILLAGLGAAVKNASPMCLEYADLVVASNDDNGVAELIDYILCAMCEMRKK